MNKNQGKQVQVSIFMSHNCYMKANRKLKIDNILISITFTIVTSSDKIWLISNTSITTYESKLEFMK